MFRIGEKVVVKSWEEMEMEFGLNEYGSIKCKFCFTENMKSVCGKTATVVYTDGTRIWLNFNSKANNYFYSADMLRHDGFTKANLETGMILETRNGMRYIYFNGFASNVDGYVKMSLYNDDLTCDGNENLDIMKVFKRNTVGALKYVLHSGKCIWKRKEPRVKEVTTEEVIELLKAKFKDFDEIKIVD